MYLITTDFEPRRRTIFAEVERKDGNTWRQVCKACLAEITGISTRIQNATQPLDYQKQSAEAEAHREQQEHLLARQSQESYGLPKIASQKIYNDRDVLQKRSGGQSVVGNVARSLGSSPDGKNPMVQYSRQAISYGIERSGGKEAWSRDGTQTTFRSRAIDFLQTPFGESFRQIFARRVEAVVFGVPYSGKINIMHASKALSKLAVASLKEDDFGQAAKDIPTIIRTYTAVLTGINGFLATCPPHWSDVYFNPDRDRDLQRCAGLSEVREVVQCLRGGLEEVLLGFGEYAGNLGLSKKEMREANEVVGKGREMVTVRDV